MYTIGVRHVQAMLLFSNSAVLYMNRLHLAVTIIAMTKDIESDYKFRIFDWNETQKSLIVSSFYWGYTLGQIPSGFLVRRFNAKLALSVCTFSTGIMTLLIPFCVPWGGWKIFCFLRAIQGLFQSCHYPAFQQHLAKWSPISERSLLNGLSNGGYYFGMVLAMFMGGMITVSPLGWPGMFYISAAASFVWCGFWLLFGANDYTTSKFIGTVERHHIETSLRSSVDFSTKKLPIPWAEIFSSAPFWAVLISRCMFCFSIGALMYYMPTYMTSVFQLKMTDNALYSTIPYLAQLLALYIFTVIAEWLLVRKYLSLTALRKCFNSIGHWLPAAMTLWIGFIDEKDKMLGIILFCVLMATSMAGTLGNIANIIDIAPNYAAILVSFINTAVNFNVMLGSLFVGYIVKDESNHDLWRLVFMIFAVSMGTGDIVYFVWGTAEEQPWNSPSAQENGEAEVSERRINNVSGTLEQTNAAFVKDL